MFHFFPLLFIKWQVCCWHVSLRWSKGGHSGEVTALQALLRAFAVSHRPFLVLPSSQPALFTFLSTKACHANLFSREEMESRKRSKKISFLDQNETPTSAWCFVRISLSNIQHLGLLKLLCCLCLILISVMIKYEAYRASCAVCLGHLFASGWTVTKASK